MHHENVNALLAETIYKGTEQPADLYGHDDSIDENSLRQKKYCETSKYDM